MCRISPQSINQSTFYDWPKLDKADFSFD